MTPPRRATRPEACRRGGFWAVYEPSAQEPWDLRRVSHLHRRAAFAATPDEIERDLKSGPKASIDQILACKCRQERVLEDFDATAAVLAESALASQNPMRLKAWWMFRMLFGPDPLGERLALLWHDHFATSNAKVDDLAAMKRQNDVSRSLARAPFGQLLDRAARDPALLVWLDAPNNRKGHPNENLAREIMELFTLGIGNYTESDVKEAARALTGWTVKDDQFAEVAEQHDHGEKTVFQRRDRWSGRDLIKALGEHPATAVRIARKLLSMFMGEGVVASAAVVELADGMRSRDLDVGWGVETIVRSSAFFADSNLGNRVLGPVELVIGSAAALQRLSPPPRTLLLAEWAIQMGQDLFYPPNVGGWPGGRSWLAARGMITRARYATALVDGEGVGIRSPLDALAIADGDVIGFASRALLGREPDQAWRDRISEAVGASSLLSPEQARRVVKQTLASPEAQLG
jgi:uncharacterized protein (DUF1800 family)